EARDVVRRRLQRAAATPRFGGTVSAAELAAEERGLIPADTLPTQFYRREIDPVSGRTIALHPVTTPPSAAFTTRDALAMAIYGRRAGQLTQAELPAVLQAEQAMKNVVTRPQALTAARTMLPNATVDQQLALAEALWQGSPAAVPGASSAASPSPPGPPAPATPTGGPGAALAPGGLRGTVATTGLGGATRESGKPLSDTAKRVVAQTRATNDLIDTALAALEPYKTQNTPGAALTMARAYKSGVYDPVSAAASQLADLAGLQASASSALTSGGTRSFQYFVRRTQHVPKLPSLRQVDVGRVLGGTATQHLSAALHGDEATFDSPQLM